MRNVRLIYKKQGRAKYISHLDMNRLFSRILKRSGLPIWYTEGFNPHIFLTFTLPLSLGFVSEYDVCDFRVTDDKMTNDHIADVLRNSVPESIEVVNVIDPVMKAKDLAFAEFKINIDCDKNNAEKLKEFLNQNEITVEKTTKKKQIKTFDVKEKIRKYDVSDTENGLYIYLLLPCGNDGNINPMLIFEKAWENIDFEIDSVARGKLFDKNMQLFH